MQSRRKPGPIHPLSRGRCVGPGCAGTALSFGGRKPMPYAAPVDEMRFVIDAVAPLDAGTAEVADAVLAEAARFAAAELDPLNRPADRASSVLENGVVRTPPGFREAYRRYVEAGWMGLHCDPAHGGQGLPWSLATAVVEM